MTIFLALSALWHALWFSPQLFPFPGNPPPPTSGGIAFDNAAGGTSMPFNMTVNSNTHGILLCEINRSAAAITSLTYNGVSMTQAGSNLGNGMTNMWMLLTPATGTHSVVSGFSSPSGICASYTGVKQSGQPSATSPTTAWNGGAITTLSTSLTTVNSNEWVVGAGWMNPGPGLGVGANTTQKAVSGIHEWIEYTSNPVSSGGSAITLTITTTSGSSAAIFIVSLIPF